MLFYILSTGSNDNHTGSLFVTAISIAKCCLLAHHVLQQHVHTFICANNIMYIATVYSILYCGQLTNCCANFNHIIITCICKFSKWCVLNLFIVLY